MENVAHSKVNETNPIAKGYHETVTFQIKETVLWSDPRLVKITRLRLVSDPGFPAWDVSYCHGQLRDGTPVAVEVPFSQLPKKNLMRSILMYAKRDKVFAKGLGLFSAISTLN